MCLRHSKRGCAVFFKYLMNGAYRTYGTYKSYGSNKSHFDNMELISLMYHDAIEGVG